MTSKERILALFEDTNDLFQVCAKKLRILAIISWDTKALHNFQKKNEKEFPEIEYNIDKEEIKKIQTALIEFAPKLKHSHPVYQWLEKTRLSYELATELLLNLETDAFFELSTRLYGNSVTPLFESSVKPLDLANQLWPRLSVCAFRPDKKVKSLMTTEECMELLQRKIDRRRPKLPVIVEISEDIAAKAVAGLSRVKVRKGAQFSEYEVDSLWNHEVETHALTAHNGLLQKQCGFLSSAGPRTTMTQEGLAVFFELYAHTMTQNRFIALCERVQAIHQVEQGANFLEIYQWFLERTQNKEEAFWATSRIFRGTKLTGGKPFTKDVVYLGGMISVFSFLQLAVKNQNYHLVESLICGRMALEDAPVIAWLRDQGILEEPFYVPKWLHNWEGLLSFFNLTSFLNSIDLSTVQQYFSKLHLFDQWDFS